MARKPPWSVDPQSYQLAKYFAPNAPEEALRELSQDIQDAVEDWFHTSALAPEQSQKHGVTPDTMIEDADRFVLPVTVKVGSTTIKAGCTIGAVLRSIKVQASARAAFGGFVKEHK